MPNDKPSYYDFLIGRGYKPDQAVKINEANIARQKEPWRYVNVPKAEPEDWLAPAPLNSTEDFARRIVNGFSNTLKGLAEIVPAAGNLIAPENSGAHKVFSDWIDNIHASIPKVETGEGDPRYNFMEHPSASNLVREAGSLLGFILPITTATMLAPETGGASYAPMAEQILGIGRGISLGRKAAEVTSFFAQSLSSADDQLRNAGVTGKDRDYLLMALPAIQVAAGELVFRGAAPLYRKAIASATASKAIKETVDEVADKFGGNLGEASFKDYFKPLTKGLTEKTINKLSDVALNAVPEGLTFATFNTVGGNVDNLIQNLYDRQVSRETEVGKGRFGAPDPLSGENIKKTATDALHGMIMGMMLGAGRSFFHPVTQDSAYSIINKAVQDEAAGANPDAAYKQLNIVRQKLTDRAAAGKLKPDQYKAINDNIDAMVSSVKEFNTRFPESRLSNPLARKQVFDLIQTEQQLDKVTATLGQKISESAPMLDPVLGKPMVGEADKIAGYLQDAKGVASSMVEKVAKTGRPLSNESVTSHFERLHNQYFEGAPKAEKQGKSINDWAALADYAKANGYSNLNDPAHLINAFHKYMGIPEEQDLNTIEVKPEDIDELVSLRNAEKGGAAPADNVTEKTKEEATNEPGTLPFHKEVDNDLDSRINSLDNQIRGMVEAATAAHGVVNQMIAQHGKASEFLKNQIGSLLGQIEGAKTQLDELKKLRASGADVNRKPNLAFVQKLVSQLGKGKFGSVEVSTSRGDFDAALSEAQQEGKAKIISNKDKVFGFIKDDKVYLNPDTVRPETPIHEFGHIWNAWAKVNAPGVFKEGEDILRQAEKYLADVKRDYPELSGDKLLDEAMARAIGENGVKVFERLGEEPGIISKVKEWLRNLWGSIKDKFSEHFGKLSPEQLSSMHIKRFAESAAKDILYGKDAEPELVGDAAHKLRDPYIMNQNDRRVDEYFDRVKNPLGYSDWENEVQTNAVINISGASKNRLTWLAKWAVNDGRPEDLKPKMSQPAAEEITDILFTNPEGKKFIADAGGKVHFADALNDAVKKDLLKGDPSTFSQLHQDIYGALTYLKGVLATDGLKLGANTNDVNDPVLFTVDEFGEPVNFGAMTRDLPDLNFGRTVMKIGAEINKMTTPKEVADAIDAEIQKYRDQNTDIAGRPLNTISEQHISKLLKLANDPKVLKDLLSGKPVMQESIDLKRALARIKLYNDTQAMNSTRYITSTGSSVDRAEMNDESEGQIATTKSRVLKTIRNNFAGKILHEAFGKAFSKVSLYADNFKTVALRIWGDENSKPFQLFYEQWPEGERKQQDIIKSMREFMSQPLAAMQKGTTHQNLQPYHAIEKDTFENYKGEKTEMTKAQLLSLYLNLRQEKYLENHKDFIDPTGKLIQGSGVTIEKTVDGEKVSVPIHFSEVDYDNLKAKIDADPVYSELVKSWDKFSGRIYPELNRLHKLIYGVELGNITNYFPATINKAGDTLSAEFVKMVENMKVVKTRSNSGDPLFVGDAIQIMNKYTNDVAKYIGFVIPSQNMEKWVKDHTEAVSASGKPDPIKPEVEYVKKFVKDINDTLTRQYIVDDSDYFQKFLSAYGVSRLMYNFSPVLKQNISYVMANQMIPSKYLWRHLPDVGKIFLQGSSKAFYTWKNTAGAEDIIQLWDKHSPYLYNRAMGSFSNLYAEANTMTGTTSILPPAYGADKMGNAKTLIRRMQTHGMEWVRIADMATIVGIQKAAIDMVRDQFPHLDPKSPEFTRIAIRKAEKVVRETQHGYDSVSKTPLQRSNNPVTKAVFLFTGQLMKQYNLMAQSTHNYLYNPTAANLNKALAYAVNVGIYNSYWVAAVTMLNGVAGGYIDPDDPDKLKKLSSDALLEFSGNFPVMNVPLSMIFTRVDDAKWKRELNIPVLQLMNQTADATQQYFKSMTEDDQAKSVKAFEKGLKQTGSTVVQGIGLPAKIFDLLTKDVGK